METNTPFAFLFFGLFIAKIHFPTEINWDCADLKTGLGPEEGRREADASNGEEASVQGDRLAACASCRVTARYTGSQVQWGTWDKKTDYRVNTKGEQTRWEVERHFGAERERGRTDRKCQRKASWQTGEHKNRHTDIKMEWDMRPQKGSRFVECVYQGGGVGKQLETSGRQNVSVKTAEWETAAERSHQ